MMFIKVDFPSPFAPTRPMCSPFNRRNDTSSKSHGRRSRGTDVLHLKYSCSKSPFSVLLKSPDDYFSYHNLNHYIGNFTLWQAFLSYLQAFMPCIEDAAFCRKKRRIPLRSSVTVSSVRILLCPYVLTPKSKMMGSFKNTSSFVHTPNPHTFPSRMDRHTPQDTASSAFLRV